MTNTSPVFKYMPIVTCVTLEFGCSRILTICRIICHIPGLHIQLYLVSLPLKCVFFPLLNISSWSEIWLLIFNSVMSLSYVRLFVTPWTAAWWASLSITNSLSPPKPMSILWVMPPNRLILCLPALNLSQHHSLSNESALLIRWPKYWSFSFNISFSSVQFSHSVVSDSLRTHEAQHARPPCPSPTPGVHSDSHPSSQWCHPSISSSVIPLSFCPQSLPAIESFPMSQLFAGGGQSTGVSALASFLPKKSQGWSPSEWTGWISMQSKGLSRVFSNTTVQKHRFFGTQLSSQSNSHIHTWLLEKP